VLEAPPNVGQLTNVLMAMDEYIAKVAVSQDGGKLSVVNDSLQVKDASLPSSIYPQLRIISIKITSLWLITF